MNKTAKKLLRRAPKNILLSIISLFCVFPLFWVIVAATNKSVDILRGMLIPGGYLAENWKTLISTYAIGPALWNSVKYSVVTTFVSLVVSSVAGYGFEVYHDKHNLCGKRCTKVLQSIIKGVIQRYDFEQK